MLKKENRIKKRSEFLNIRDKGYIVQSPFFGLAFLKDNSNISQFGFVISKRISKRAVDRNRIKRYLSNSIKLHWSDFNQSWQIVFLAKKEILFKCFKEIDYEVAKIFEQLKSDK